MRQLCVKDNERLHNLLNKFVQDNTRVPPYTGNLNDIKETSIYNVSDRPDGPVSDWGFVITFIHCFANTYRTQLYVTMTGSNNYNIYKRNMGGGTWGKWFQISGKRFKDYAFYGTAVAGQSDTLTYPAGTIGTRGSQAKFSIADIYNAGYHPVSATVVYVSGSETFIPVPMIWEGDQSVMLNLYRASTSALTATGNIVTVRVFYI